LTKPPGITSKVLQEDHSWHPGGEGVFFTCLSGFDGFGHGRVEEKPLLGIVKFVNQEAQSGDFFPSLIAHSRAWCLWFGMWFYRGKKKAVLQIHSNIPGELYVLYLNRV